MQKIATKQAKIQVRGALENSMDFPLNQSNVQFVLNLINLILAKMKESIEQGFQAVKDFETCL